MDPNHFGKLAPDPNPRQIKIRIRICLIVNSWIRIRNFVGHFCHSASVYDTQCFGSALKMGIRVRIQEQRFWSKLTTNLIYCLSKCFLCLRTCIFLTYYLYFSFKIRTQIHAKISCRSETLPERLEFGTGQYILKCRIQCSGSGSTMWLNTMMLRRYRDSRTCWQSSSGGRKDPITCRETTL